MHKYKVDNRPNSVIFNTIQNHQTAKVFFFSLLLDTIMSNSKVKHSADNLEDISNYIIGPVSQCLN